MEVRSIFLVSLRTSSHPRSIDAHINKHNNAYHFDDTYNITVLRSLLQRCTLVYIQPGAHKAHP